MSGMFRHIAAFEFRYQVGSPLFYATAIIFGLLAFGATTSDQIQIGAIGNTNVNSPFAVTRMMLVLSVFAVFIISAFVANVVIRDEETRFGPIVRSTRVSKFDYLFGRFSGAFAAGCLAFAAVPLAMALGAAMPWLDPDKLGPFHLSTYLYAYFVFCVPSLFVTGAGCFALATLTRSLIATYVGVVVFMTAYFISVNYFGKPEYEHVVGLVDAFGLGAFDVATKYWTATERNTQLPAVAGLILWNRVTWLVMAFVLLALAWRAFRKEARVSKRQHRKATAATATATAAATATATEAAAAASAGNGAHPALRTAALPRPRADGATAFAQLLALARFDMAGVFRSPAFFVLLGIGFLNAFAGLWGANENYGVEIYPVTRVMIQSLVGAFSIIPLIIAIYYGGELVWRDRERRVSEIVDATSAPDWTFAIPKILALTFVLVATVAVSTLAAMFVQLARGYTNFELEKFLLWYIVPQSIDVAMMAVLAVFIQTLVPHKFAGWLAMLLVIVAQLTLSKLGFEHGLYQFGDGPPVPLSDMNGQGHFAQYRGWFRGYWSAISVLLVVLTYALWRRGTAPTLWHRVRRMPRRLAGIPAAIAVVAAVVALALGAFVYYNTNFRNEYRTHLDDERFAADYEKALLQYEKTPQPRIEDVRLDVALFPEESRAVTKGQYTLVNRTSVPLDTIHVRWDRLLDMEQLEIPDASLATNFQRFHYRIYKLAQPLAPGGTLTLRFVSLREQQGFRNSNNETRVVGNGTFLDSTEIAPFLGMGHDMLLTDRAKRRKYGLPPDLRLPKLEDQSARANHYLRRDSDWVTADITVSTVAEQIPIAPGYKQSESVAGGRRTAHFKTEAPIMNFFSIQSAAYAVRNDRWHDVNLAIYYHPSHDWNIDRMVRAMQVSLDYCSREFSPFQFRQLRILEFPEYADFAQSFANTIPYSEGVGFIQNYKDSEKIDMVTYVTAHEIGHQWWAHQIIGGEMQGETMLSETLAQYSALMVMEHLYGPEHIRKFLKFELDRYLRRRGGEVIEELPLERVEDQPYIHYQKGALVMYLLKDTIGEEKVNRALRSLLQEFAFKGPPYPTSLDLIKRFRAEVGPDQQQLITDLFEKITLYDVKVTGARRMKRADGKWDVAIDVDASKLYADGQGKETAAPLHEEFDVGVFSADPQGKEFKRDSVLTFEKQRVHSGKQTLHVLTRGEPKFAGVDPYIKHVDRNSDDNVVAVK